MQLVFLLANEKKVCLYALYSKDLLGKAKIAVGIY